MNDFPEYPEFQIDPGTRAMVDHVFGRNSPITEHWHRPPSAPTAPPNLTAAAALASGIIAASGRPHTVAEAVAVMRDVLAALDAEPFDDPPEDAAH